MRYVATIIVRRYRLKVNFVIVDSGPSTLGPAVPAPN